MENKKETRHRRKACSKTRRKIKVTCCSPQKKKGRTVTSACDLGEMCHLGLFLLHAVIAQRVALLQQAHTCTKIHHCLQQSQQQLTLSAYFTLRRAMKSGVGKHPPRLQAVWFLLTSCHHQRNGPSCPTFLVDYTSPIDRHPITYFRMALQRFWSEVLCLCNTRILQP